MESALKKKILYVDRNAFESILSGCKTSLIQNNSDHQYQMFDEIKILERNEVTNNTTGNSIKCLITFMSYSEVLPKDYVVFSIKPLYSSVSLSPDR